MPTSRRAAQPSRAAEFAVLGLLAREQVANEGIHGYVLMQRFNESALREIVRIEPGMLYHHLKRLAATDLVVTTIERQQGRPDRQLHAITGAGREALDTWVREPVRATRELRLEFLVKLYLARHQGNDATRALIAAQATVLDASIGSLQDHLASIADDTPDAAFRRQLATLRLTQTHAARAWLDTVHP
jgi:DNA-binding PadR family transcriptional regulator